jgi:hypothetical protein
MRMDDGEQASRQSTRGSRTLRLRDTEKQKTPETNLMILRAAGRRETPLSLKSSVLCTLKTYFP